MQQVNASATYVSQKTSRESPSYMYVYMNEADWSEAVRYVAFSVDSQRCADKLGVVSTALSLANACTYAT